MNEGPVTPIQIVKTVAAAGTPEPLAAGGTYFRVATVAAKKAARTDNVGNVYLGVGAANDSQPLKLLPAEEIEIKSPDGQRYDLNDFYLDVETAGDGVVVIYS